MRATKEDTLRVAGATLFYRVTGSGPTLLILPGGIIPVSGGSFTGDRLRGDILPHAGSDLLSLVPTVLTSKMFAYLCARMTAR
jgi:hypothetical protein